MKKLLLLVTVLVLSFSSICFASDGTNLDAEQKIAASVIDVYYKNGNIEELKQYCTADFAKNALNATSISRVRKELDDKFGKVDNIQFAAFERASFLDANKKAHPANNVVFAGRGEKNVVVLYNFLFDVSGKKPILINHNISGRQIQQQEKK